MKESAIEARLKKGIEKLGGRCDKWTSPNLPGVPDRIVILPRGRIIFVELKTEFGRIANIQKWYISELEKRGADVRVLKGKDAVDEFLKEVSEDGVHTA